MGVTPKSKSNRQIRQNKTELMKIDLSRKDKREYRFHELSNGLRVILVTSPKDDTIESKSIKKDNSNDGLASAAVCVRVGSFSDPDCAPGLSNLLSRIKNYQIELDVIDGHIVVVGLLSQASAAVCVRVGSFSDPDCAPGLSNLLSRMLLLSDKASDDFQVLVSAHGGQSGSYTTNEYTCYYFQVESSHFPQCLERFSSHLCEPMLCVNRIEEQVERMDVEFKGENVDLTVTSVVFVRSSTVDVNPAQYADSFNTPDFYQFYEGG
ncbi:hypothetical protein AHF37_07160 [Paragonimus kellicotti]|nr:hypothetical protein AHF37_07160 [Paragonimus kellicotti]